MKRPLGWVAQRLGVTNQARLDVLNVTGWSIDSRTLVAGDLYFALRGPNHDGHAYIGEVFRKGAVGVVVDRKTKDESGPILPVEDVLRALQHVAAEARREWGGDVVAVTGSAGKTSTKEAIAAMLAAAMETAKNEGNLNNHVGLPLSLLRVADEARVAVLEMGMNHAGEIRALARIARPNVGVVTNVGYAHIDNFGSVDGIAAAKRELIEELGSQGTAVLNADDARVKEFARVHSGRTVLYGFSAEADVRAEDAGEVDTSSCFRVGPVEFQTSLLGFHNVSNLVAGIAVASVFGIGPEKVVDAVKGLAPGKMRGERSVSPQGATVLNDCYNSNPDAAHWMLDALRGTAARRRIAVLGEMRELGDWSERLHEEVGRYAAECGIDVIVGVQGAARVLVEEARREGVAEAWYFEQPEEAGRFVRGIARVGDAILFKGSRGVRVEKALEQLMAPDEGSRG